MFLTVKIGGKGLIPRLGGIAPRTSPVKADPSFIHILMATPGITLQYLNPETNTYAPLTRTNVTPVLGKYGNWNYDTNKEYVQVQPVAPVEKDVKREVKETVVAPGESVSEIENPQPETHKEEKVIIEDKLEAEDKVEEPKQDQGFKPQYSNNKKNRKSNNGQ